MVKAQTAKEKAEAINNFFASVYHEESDGVPVQNSVFSGTALSNINITREMVMNKLNLLNTGKPTGPDGLHPYFLYSLAGLLYTPLTILFKKSLSEGIVPSQWIEAYITAIHKKGIKNVVENYRPISITSVVCKIMESIIRDHLVEHMVSKYLFADSQHGFVPNRDCMSNLLLASEDWTQSIALGHSVDLIYTDFAMAFDSVSHKRLLVKLESAGIKGEVLTMDYIILDE